MNIYQHHRSQQRETRSLGTANTNGELTKLPSPNPNPGSTQRTSRHLDPDRVLPPLATSSDGSKFIPFWKRNPPPHPPTQQLVQQQQQHPSSAAAQQQPLPPLPKKKWLTQAEMGMVLPNPAIIPVPIPTARTSTTSTTTTTTNTSTTTNNNVGTTVSSSGSGITASSVTGRTFNYNYNNYNHHVHQFNQPLQPNNRHSNSNQATHQPGAGGGGGAVTSYNATRKHLSWHAAGGRASHVIHAAGEEEYEMTEEDDPTEEDATASSASVPPSPQYGILDLPPTRGVHHRRGQSYPHGASSFPSRDFRDLRDIREIAITKQKNSKKLHSDALPTPPAVLVLQTANHQKGEYTPSYGYSLKLDRHLEERRTHGEKKKKKRRGQPREDEGSAEDDESEESEDPRKKRKSNGEKKNGKSRKTKTKAKSKARGKLVLQTKKKKKGASKRRGEESEEEESEEDEDESEEDSDESEDEDEDDDDDDVEEEYEVRKKPKKRAAALSSPGKSKKRPQQDTFVSVNGNQASQHRLSRSEDYARQSSRHTPPVNVNVNRWPTDLPRLPRSPGTPADGMPNPGSPTKQDHNDTGYFDYQPHQTNNQNHQPAQPQTSTYSQRSQPSSSRDGPYTPATTTSTTTRSSYSNLSSSTPVSSYSTYSTPGTSYTSSATSATSAVDPSKQRSRERSERSYMDLDDPPPVSLRRSPSPIPSSGHSNSSHPPLPSHPLPPQPQLQHPQQYQNQQPPKPYRHSHNRSLPQIAQMSITGPNPTPGYGSSSSPTKTYQQIRARVEQTQPMQNQQQPPLCYVQIPTQVPTRLPQAPQPTEPVRRYSQPVPAGSSNFHSSQAFWQQQVQQQQPQPQPLPLHPHLSMPLSSAAGGSYGMTNGYVHAPAHVSTTVTSAPTAARRRELPPQPAQGRERAQEILKEAMERQAALGYSPSPSTSSQVQTVHQQQQWHPPPRTQPTSSFPTQVQPVQQGLQQRYPLPQPSIPNPSGQPQVLSSQPQQQQAPQALPIQQYRQPIVQHPQYSQHRQPQNMQQPLQTLPQQLPQQPQAPPSQRLSRHPLPQPPVPPVQPEQRVQQQSSPQLPQRQPPQQQQQQSQTQPRPRAIQQPPQAQKNVYRPSTMPVESPLPVGGRDKVANIPRMGKAASVASSVGSEGQGSAGSVGSLSTSDSDAEGSRPGGERKDRSISSASASPMPIIHVQEDKGNQDPPQPSPNVPQVQVFEVPGISFSGPDEGSSGGGPSISISGPEDDASTSHPSQSRPQSQPTPQLRSPEQRAKSAPAFADRGTGSGFKDNTIVRRPQGGLCCGGCGGPIIGRIVSAMGARWHPECFKCSNCNTLLEHVSSYEHEGKPYCHLDYHEKFAPRCYHCETAIVEEKFISLDDPALGKRTYHQQHFFCAECGDPFLTPSTADFETDDGDGGEKWSGELALSGDGEFESDNVGFTVYRGHPYCESCHVRLRLPKCKRCKKSIRDGDRAVEALGGKWCWACFVCESCQKPFEDPAFFQRGEKPYCEPCFSVMLRNEV